MLKKNWFRILLLISLCFEVYMLLTYKITYQTMLHQEESSVIIITLNILYAAFNIACFYKGYGWQGFFILTLSFVRDLILSPNKLYTPTWALIDSVICIVMMITVCIGEYIKFKNRNVFVPVWSVEDIQKRTNVNNSFISCMTQKLFNYQTDPQQSDRRADHRCKLCEYVQDKIEVGIELHCMMCGKELSHEHITRLCPECAEKHDACISCGGKMD